MNYSISLSRKQRLREDLTQSQVGSGHLESALLLGGWVIVDKFTYPLGVCFLTCKVGVSDVFTKELLQGLNSMMYVKILVMQQVLKQFFK